MSRGWVRFLVRRFALMLLTMFLVSVVIFLITEVMPGDAAQYLLGQNVTEEALAALRRRLGLDQPAPVRYVTWLANAVRGDLGFSGYLNGDITPVLLIRLRNSVVLGALGFLFVVPSVLFPAPVFSHYLILLRRSNSCESSTSRSHPAQRSVSQDSAAANAAPKAPMYSGSSGMVTLHSRALCRESTNPTLCATPPMRITSG